MSRTEITNTYPDRPRILRLPKVLARTGLGRSAAYEGIKAGTFPAPVHLTARAVGWIESEINAWIEARAAARDSEATR